MAPIYAERTHLLLCERRAGLAVLLITGMSGMLYLGYQVLHAGL